MNDEIILTIQSPPGESRRRRRCPGGSSAGTAARWPGSRRRCCAWVDVEAGADQERLADPRDAEVLPDVALVAEVDRRAERGDPLRAHPVAVGEREDCFAVDRAFEDAEAHVQAAARRPGEEAADGDDLLPLVEEVENGVADQRQPVADVPAEVVVQQPDRLAEVVAVGVGEEASRACPA